MNSTTKLANKIADRLLRELNSGRRKKIHIGTIRNACWREIDKLEEPFHSGFQVLVDKVLRRVVEKTTEGDVVRLSS